MILVNTETVPGYEIEAALGLVQGNTIRAKHLGRDIAASLKNLVGGELRGYTELLTEARRQALERMMAQAEQLGGNAIVNVRFTTSAVSQGAAELYAYGTAVRVRRIEAETAASQIDGAAMFRKENVPAPDQLGQPGQPGQSPQ